MLEMTNLSGCNITCCDIALFKKKQKTQCMFQHKAVRPVVIGWFWCLRQIFFFLNETIFFFSTPPSPLPDVQLSDERVD